MKIKPENREQTEKAETVLAGTPENHLHIKTEIRKVGQNNFLGQNINDVDADACAGPDTDGTMSLFLLLVSPTTL